MKIVFLDIDGVLNSDEFHTRQHAAGVETPWPQGHLDRKAVEVLNEVVEKTGAMVVVSSVWRIGQLRTWLQEQLTKAGFKGTVLGSTPVLKDVRRGTEIQSWLDNQARMYERRFGKVERYVILDDDTDMEHLYSKLVHIDYRTGLTNQYLVPIFRHLGLKETGDCGGKPCTNTENATCGEAGCPVCDTLIGDPT